MNAGKMAFDDQRCGVVDLRAASAGVREMMGRDHAQVFGEAGIVADGGPGALFLLAESILGVHEVLMRRFVQTDFHLPSAFKRVAINAWISRSCVSLIHERCSRPYCMPTKLTMRWRCQSSGTPSAWAKAVMSLLKSRYASVLMASAGRPARSGGSAASPSTDPPASPDPSPTGSATASAGTSSSIIVRGSVSGAGAALAPRSRGCLR